MGLSGRANVVRIQIQTGAGRQAAERYGAVFTPTFVVFDGAGTVVARETNAGTAGARLRSLLGIP